MTLVPGDRLGRYEILSRLGAGGMGEVFRARDQRLDRDVAIKVLHEAVAQDPDRLARFEREAKAVAALSHPNILEIFDFGAEGDTTYAVAELLEGMSLRERLERGPMPWREAVEIGARIADGLSAAHAKAIVHRDLKPANVFLTRDDQTKILDFGLAKVLEPEKTESGASEIATASMATRAGAVMGTSGYMSPEQLRGEPVDHRTDIFALGCLLYESLCDRRAFRGDTTADVASAVLTHRPAPLQEFGCDAPPDVQRIIDRCLEKEPAKRFQGAADLSFALRSLVTDAPTGTEVPVTKPRRLWPLIAAVGCVAAAAALAFFLLGDRQPAETTLSLTDLDPDLVAVATFENRTGNPELDHLGLMAADWITHGLAQVDRLQVVPIEPGSGSGVHRRSPQDVAERTGAGIVVTGAYYLDRDTLRFQSTVTDAASNTVLRSVDPTAGPVDQPMKAIEPLQSRVIGGLASLVSGGGPGFNLYLRPPRYDAYREYIAGLWLFAVDNPKAVAHFQRAAELDPGFVTPLLMMSSILSAWGQNVEAKAVVDRLEEQRHEMTNLERHLLDYYQTKLQGNFQQAVQHLRLAEQQAPQSLFVKFGLANNLLAVGQLREALETIQTVPADAFAGGGMCAAPLILRASLQHVLAEHDEELATVNQTIGICGDRVSLRRYQARAVAAAGRLAQLDGVLGEALTAPGAKDGGMRLFLETARELAAHGHVDHGRVIADRGVAWFEENLVIGEATEWQRLRLIQSLVMLDRLVEADAILATMVEELPDDDDVLGWCGIVAARRADTASANQFSNRLRNLDRPYLFGWNTYYRAAIEAHIGHPDKALGLLRDALSEGRQWDAEFHTCLELAPLRGIPEFEAILHPEG
jgi:serine/threonine protein kinase/tetratricopeptide (TPR) repeat protein